MTGSHFNNYNKDLKQYARNLRNNSTLAEIILWDKILKKSQLRGYPFLRQRPIKNFIVDFFCKDLNLIIELDGPIHRFQKKKDKQRENELKELGFSIIRFGNEDVLNDLIHVEKTLEGFIDVFEEKNGRKEPRISRERKRALVKKENLENSDKHPSNSPEGRIEEIGIEEN
jgi:very-short-patch-repair endonuclease